LVLTIDASTFKVNQLIISDIAVDVYNNIYIVDKDWGIRTFSYLASNRIVKGLSYLIKGEQHFRVRVISQSGKTTVLLGTSAAIKELQVIGKALTVYRKYELPQ
jgi:hypothetical protein